MSDLFALKVLLFAGEALAASTFLMGLAWLAGGAKRASLRHLAWAAAFGVLIVLPLIVLFVPGLVVWSLPAPPPALELATVAAAPALAPAPSGWHLATGDVASVLIGVWLVGATLIALRHLLAAILLRALRRDSVEHPFDMSELPAIAGRLRYNLRLSRGARGPVTWGVIRPVILLPNAAQFWPYDRLQAVLRHEFAHVQRRDGFSQMLASLACALYWPNPLVWLGARALKREAEIAADDAVIASGMAPSDYAGELLGMAKEFRASGLAGALSMAAPSALPARVKAILAPTPHRSGVTFMDVVKMAAVALLTAGALAAAHPSLAQDAPPVAMATPPAAPPAAVAAPDAPPAPPAPAAVPTPAEPPTPPSAVDAPDTVVRIVRSAHGDRDARRLRIEMAHAEREMHDAMARVNPEIARIVAAVHAHDIATRRIVEMRPQIDAEVTAALAEARAQLAQIDDKAIRAKVDAALARAQARIDQAATHESRRVVITDDGNSDTP